MIRKIQIGNTYYKLPDEEKVKLITFEWENSLTGRTDYFMNVFYEDGSKITLFIGNEKESAKKLYHRIASDILTDVEVYAR